jgi:hypothetical protein
MAVILEDLVDMICLVYHEARNIRHPVREHKVSNSNSYAKLINLPKNRDKAWDQMGVIRDRAVRARTPDGAAAFFERQFALDLADLVDLYEKPFWKHSAYGGHRWAPITTKVRDLACAMSSENDSQAQELHSELLEMPHNTGDVATKLKSLKSQMHP